VSLPRNCFGYTPHYGHNVACATLRRLSTSSKQIKALLAHALPAVLTIALNYNQAGQLAKNNQSNAACCLVVIGDSVVVFAVDQL